MTVHAFGKAIPAEWLSALAIVQRSYPNAIIAGGCIRDLILGGQVKDIDIFVPADTLLSEDFWPLHDAGWMSYGVLIDASYIHSMRDEVSNVCGFIVPDLDLPVQIIAIKPDCWISAYSPLNRMDFGACQVGTDGKEFFYTAPALQDLCNRRITLLEPRDLTQAERSMKRADRFVQKYAGTDVVVNVDAAIPFLTFNGPGGITWDEAFS